MARNQVRLDSAGLRKVLNSAEMRRVVAGACEAVKANVEAQGIRVGDQDGGKHEIPLPVTAKVVTTDRAHGLVTLAHPAGLSVQAKHGALTKAAAQAGLDVRVQ